jgi:ubiquitin carboxyl-terminal hydrolase 25
LIAVLLETQLTINLEIVLSLLARLFHEMEYAEPAAVTPDLELAKLALVTSKDEEEDAVGEEQQGTDSSNDTDATLVEEAAAANIPGTMSPPVGSTAAASVLGKRPRGEDALIEMDIDAKDRDYVIVSKPPSPTSTTAPGSSSNGKASFGLTKDVDGDVVMSTDLSVAENRPSTVPKKRTAPPTSDSTMMFGKWST